MPVDPAAPRRRRRLWLALALALALGLAGGAPSAAGQSAPGGPTARERPNILFVLADDLGHGDPAYLGGSARTPHLDRLAAEGVRLTEHYATPQCTPSRAALLTGLFPSRLGDHATKAFNGKVLPDSFPTLARALADLGYDTRIAGKWHVGVTFADGPRRHGFARAYGLLNGGCTAYGHFYKRPDSLTWFEDTAYLAEPGHVTDLLTAKVVSWVEEAAADGGGRPWFYYLPYSAVHIPVQVPPEWLATYRDSAWYADPRLNAAAQRYAAYLTQMDDGLGQVVAALERTGQRANTLIVFASDNGSPRDWVARGRYPDEGQEDAPVLGSNAPFRGWKREVYEGGIRVPAIASWPRGRISAAALAEPTHLVDWYPTLVEAAGCDTCAAGLDGRSLLPALRGEAAPAPPRDLYWKFPGASALRYGDLKLVATTAPDGTPVRELYHVGEDPLEQRDLALRPQNAHLVERLALRLEAQRAADVRVRRERVPYQADIEYGNLHLNPTGRIGAPADERAYHGQPPPP